MTCLYPARLVDYPFAGRARSLTRLVGRIGLWLWSTQAGFSQISPRPLVAFTYPVQATHPVTAVATLSISGTVRNGEPLPGATVLLKGTTTGTSTNAQGAYTLLVPDRTGKLRLLFIGYTSVDVPINNRSVVNATLTATNQALNEVVVVGYGTQRKVDVTGATVTIKGDELVKQPVLTATQALQGKAAGVQIISSGQPGNATGFMEGTAWIYSFFVPHDIPQLVRMVGQERFNQRLEEGFAKGYADFGNQPNLQAPFLFNYSGKPYLTQKYSRQVLRTLFNNSLLTGRVGEEDEGQLSSLYVLMAMGLFEMDGGIAARPSYDLSSPLFSRMVLHLDKPYYGGRTFTIEAPGNSETNVYIQSAMLNGKLLTPTVLYHDEKGGKLIRQMGPKPNLNWENE